MKTKITAENYDKMAKRIGWLATELTRLYEQMITAKMVANRPIEHSASREKQITAEIIELDEALQDANLRLTDLHLQNFDFDVAGVITEIEKQGRITDKSKMKKELPIP